MNNKVVVIAGPTAVGKTRLSIELAKSFGGEIVSADSMQIYRGMDIGTAKATPEERAQVSHHMLDVADPREDYSVARYVEEASAVCDDILRRGKLPIITGGTGLYIDSLLAGRDFARAQEDRELRCELSRRYDEAGGEALLSELAAFDPERAQKLHAADRRRIIRAMEIYYLTGVTATEHDRQTRLLPPRYDAARIVLNCRERADLYRRIDGRVDAMCAAGLFEEVRGLLDAGLSPDCTALQAIGYKEAALALSGQISREEAAGLIKLNSRRYAKRQLTWFRKYDDALHILFDSVPDFEQARRLSTDFLTARGIS